MQTCGRLDGRIRSNRRVTILHPWRQKEDGGEPSPYFHILCYGRIDTTSFRKANPGRLIKRVHARGRIGRIGHTAAYPMTHMGLGMAEREYDDLVMANPFEEPDEYILRRQRVAFGTETEVLMWFTRPCPWIRGYR